MKVIIMIGLFQRKQYRWGMGRKGTPRSKQDPTLNQNGFKKFPMWTKTIELEETTELFKK